MKHLVIVVAFFISVPCLTAQQAVGKGAEGKKEKKDLPIKFHGGIALNGQYSTSLSDASSRYIPWTAGVSGNLSMQIGDFKIPISLYFTDTSLDASYRNFNRIGISPTYKGIKFHLGHRTMQFSPYVLNGNTFFGAGVEIQQGLLRLSAMRGKLKNISFVNSSQTILGLDFLNDYNRNATAIKLGIGKQSSFFDLVVFKANDTVFDELTDEITDQNYNLNPKDNFAIGFNTSFNLKNGFYLNSSVMTSLYNENAEARSLDTDIPSALRSNFDPNITSQFGYAGQTDFGVRFKRINIGLSYERISPQFETLGRYYNLKDLDRRRVNVSYGSKTINIQSSYGIEENEIASTNTNRNKRVIVSGSARWKPSKKFNLTSTVSNFNVDNTPTILDDDDTLKVSRILTNVTLSPRFRFGNDNEHTLRLRGMMRKLDNKFVFATETQSTYVYNAKIDFRTTLKKYDLKLGTYAGYQVFQYAVLDKVNYSFGVNAAKKLLEDKLSMTLSSRYVINTVIEKSNGFGLNSTLNLRYAINNNNSATLNLLHYIRNRNVGLNINELRSRVSYQFTF